MLKLQHYILAENKTPSFTLECFGHQSIFILSKSVLTPKSAVSSVGECQDLGWSCSLIERAIAVIHQTVAHSIHI
jgi:hypothetical protein